MSTLPVTQEERVARLTSALGVELAQNEIERLTDYCDHLRWRTKVIIPQEVVETRKIESRFSEQITNRLLMALIYHVATSTKINPEKAAQIVVLSTIIHGPLQNIEAKPSVWEDILGLFIEFGNLQKLPVVLPDFREFFEKRRQTVNSKQVQDEQTNFQKIYHGYRKLEAIPGVALPQILDIPHHYFENFGKFFIDLIRRLRGKISEFESNYPNLWRMKGIYEDTVRHIRNSRAHGSYKTLSRGTAIELRDINPRSGEEWRKTYSLQEFWHFYYQLNTMTIAVEILIPFLIYWEEEKQDMASLIETVRKLQ